MERTLPFWTSVQVSEPTRFPTLVEERLESLRQDDAEAERQRKEQAAVIESALKSDSSQTHRKKMEEMSPWGEDEMRLLDKALKKFPLGEERDPVDRNIRFLPA